ncbi:hypothetical protein [Haloarcula sp. H-GB5]
MKFSRFKIKYPNTASLLPQEFMKKAGDEHHLRKSIDRNRLDYLDLVERLVAKSPAEAIAQGSFQNSLHLKGKFSAFVSELRGSRIMNELCYPTPADVPGSSGLPDLKCDSYGRHGIDVEITRLSSWDKMDNVQTKVTDMFDGTTYTPVVNWTDYFYIMPYDYKQIRANEIFVEDILDDLDNINPSNPPKKIENYGIEIEFEKSNPSNGIIASSTVRAFPVDPEQAVESRVKEKAKKQRGSRPLIIFVDSLLSFLDLIDMKQILLGTTTGTSGSLDISPELKQYEPVWGDYLKNNGYLPSSSKGRISGIQRGDEGIFSEKEFRYVAGVLFFDRTNTAQYLPNVYSDKIEHRSIHEDIEQSINSRMFSNI